MTDGNDTTLDQITPETPASAEVETSSEATEKVFDLDAEKDTAEAPEEGHDDNDEADVDDDLEEEEVERNGKKYRIPKALKGELMMQSDYTRKTQEVAEERKALEARKAEIDQQATRTTELTEDRKKLVLLDDYLDRQAKVDWNKLWQDDPLDAPRKWAEYQHWKDQRTSLSTKVESAEQEVALVTQRETVKRVEEALSEAKKIPGWSTEVAKKVESHATTYGLSVPQMDKLVMEYGAPIIKMAHEAYLGRQFIQKQQAAPKTPATTQEPIKPLAQVAPRGSSPSARKSLASMSMEEYAAARKAGRAV